MTDHRSGLGLDSIRWGYGQVIERTRYALKVGLCPMTPSNLEGCIEVEGSPQKDPTVLGPDFLVVRYRNAQYTIDGPKVPKMYRTLKGCPHVQPCLCNIRNNGVNFPSHCLSMI